MHGTNNVLIYTFHQASLRTCMDWTLVQAQWWAKHSGLLVFRKLQSSRRHSTVSSNINWVRKYELPCEDIVGPLVLILGRMGGESREFSFAFFHSKVLHSQSQPSLSKVQASGHQKDQVSKWEICQDQRISRRVSSTHSDTKHRVLTWLCLRSQSIGKYILNFTAQTQVFMGMPWVTLWLLVYHLEKNFRLLSQFFCK